MSGGGVSVPSAASAAANAPVIQPLKNPLVQAPQPAISNPTAFTFPGMNAGGIIGQQTQGGYYLDASVLDKPMQGLSSTFLSGASQLGQLGQTVQPGFSQLRQTGLQNIENQRQATQSNLQSNMAQRRVLGSSFANSSTSNVNADFATQAANFISQSYLQELSTSQNLITQQTQMASQAYQSQINEANFGATLGAQLSSDMGKTLASVAETQGQLDLSAAQTNAQGAIAQAQLQLQEQQMMVQASEFNAQMQMAEMMGIGQLAGGLLGGMGGGGKSDRRVKRDIKQIGEWANGLPVYLFRYIFDPRWIYDPGWFVGFMAQDVEQVMPDAVYEIGGVKHVNYRLAVL